MYIYICVCVCVCVDVCVCVSVCMYRHLNIQRALMKKHKSKMYTYIYLYIHEYVYISIYIYIHVVDLHIQLAYIKRNNYSLKWCGIGSTSLPGIPPHHYPYFTPPLSRRTCLIHTCMTWLNSYVRHDSLLRRTRLRTHAFVRHDSFVCGTWLIYPQMYVSFAHV